MPRCGTGTVAGLGAARALGPESAREKASARLDMFHGIGAGRDIGVRLKRDDLKACSVPAATAADNDAQLAARAR
jgi:hypothetical protein